MSNKISLNIRCPSCLGELQPSVLLCHSCGIKIEGEFIKNEFNSLAPDELHLLRVFIRCEGRISDMEAALGVSYPTVKAHLADLKKKLNLAGQASVEGKIALESSAEPKPETPADDEALLILSQLESGEIDFKKAVQILRAKKKETGK
jgi:hypothetical protein